MAQRSHGRTDELQTAADFRVAAFLEIARQDRCRFFHNATDPFFYCFFIRFVDPTFPSPFPSSTTMLSETFRTKLERLSFRLQSSERTTLAIVFLGLMLDNLLLTVVGRYILQSKQSKLFFRHCSADFAGLPV